MRTEGTFVFDGHEVTCGEVVRGGGGTFAALPVGAVVAYSAGGVDGVHGERWVKDHGDLWRCDLLTGRNSAMSRSGNVLVGVPDECVPVSTDMEFVIGELMSAEQIEALPVGSVMDAGGSYTMTKEQVGWVGSNGAIYTLPAGGYNTLVSIPSQPIVPHVEPEETVEVLQQRLASLALKAAEGTKHPIDKVYEALEDLGITPYPQPGEVIHPSAEVPDGTTARYSDPHLPDFTMWQREDGHWVQTFGSHDSADNMDHLVVVSSPNPARTVPLPNEAELIAEWRTMVWDKGWQFKTENRWCSAYERVLSEVGITEANATTPRTLPARAMGFEVYPTIPMSGPYDFGDGALSARVIDVQYMVSIKREGRWQRLFGHDSAQGAPDRYLLWNGTGLMRIPLAGISHIGPDLPVGSQIRGHATWTKDDDGFWYRPDRTRKAWDTFAFSRVYLTRVGPATEPEAPAPPAPFQWVDTTSTASTTNSTAF